MSNQSNDLVARLNEHASVAIFNAGTFRVARETMREAATEIDRVYGGIRALQARCCGSDDLCNGCRALLALLPQPVRSELRQDSPEIQFADVFAELDKGYPVNTQDAINALWWKVRNQRLEIARLHERNKTALDGVAK